MSAGPLKGVIGHDPVLQRMLKGDTTRAELDSEVARLRRSPSGACASMVRKLLEVRKGLTK